MVTEKSSERSALARSDPVLRVLPWRQWRGYRRESSNGLDRFGGAVDQVVSGVEVERLLEKGFEAAAMKIVRSY